MKNLGLVNMQCGELFVANTLPLKVDDAKYESHETY